MAPPIDLDDDLENADDNYHESSDEDFNPEGAPADESESSDNDDEQATGKATKGAAKGKGKGKRKAAADDGLDSGDEVTIEAARKRKSKKRKGGKTDDDDLLLSDDEGDEGGLIKTRAQRRTEQKERKPLARTDGATVDVDALWAQMMAAPLVPLSQTKTETADESKGLDIAAGGAVAFAAQEEEEQVTVKKIYTFAGQRTEEEKQIPRSSLDQYISDGWKAVDAPGQTEDADGKTREGDKDTGPKIRRPLQRPSRFDPNPTGYVRALPPEFQLTWPRKGVAAVPAGQENVPAAEAPKTKLEKAQKLNVVDKSRLDWTGFVDKEGIADELDTHGKTKEAYLGRMQFLAGVEARREEERRKAKSSATAS